MGKYYNVKQDVNVLKYLLFEAVKKCLSQSKKVAIQLSGGLDSAIIQAIAKVDNLYCATWKELDNISLAKHAAMNFKVNEVTFSKEEMIKVLPTVKKITNGQGTWSQVCQYFLCEKIASHGCDLVLTGEGADELFGGYSRYRIIFYIDEMLTDPRLKKYRSIIEYMFGSKKEIAKKMLCRNMSEIEVENLLDKYFEEDFSILENVMEIDKCENLPKLLNFGEAIAEHHGLKCLFPFMDTSIQNFSLNLEIERKVNRYWNKAILRELARDLDINDTIVYELTKKGLFIPQSWRPKNEPKWSRKWFEKLMTEI